MCVWSVFPPIEKDPACGFISRGSRTDSWPPSVGRPCLIPGHAAQASGELIYEDVLEWMVLELPGAVMGEKEKDIFCLHPFVSSS